MNVITAIEEFENSLNGTDSYVTLSQKMKALLESETRNHCAYSLILRFCQSYVLTYQDQAISSEFAEKAKKVMNDYLAQMKASYINNDKVIALDVLDTIAKDYELNNKIF